MLTPPRSSASLLLQSTFSDIFRNLNHLPFVLAQGSCVRICVIRMGLGKLCLSSRVHSRISPTAHPHCAHVIMSYDTDISKCMISTLNSDTLFMRETWMNSLYSKSQHSKFEFSAICTFDFVFLVHGNSATNSSNHNPIAWMTKRKQNYISPHTQ